MIGIRHLSIALVVLVVLCSVNGQAAERAIAVKVKTVKGEDRNVTLYQGSYALVIGASNYTAGWPILESVRRDAKKLETALTANGFSVTRVDDPDSRGLKRAFEEFIANYGYDEKNRLLFFFSGHGHSRKQGEKGYLVPVDAPDPNVDEKNFMRKALPMTQIMAWARDIEARHALFLFDSCFSGTVFKMKAKPKASRYIREIATKPVRQFITAGSAGETVPAESTFTPAFIDAITYGLADLNSDGYISGTELGLFLQQEIPRHIAQTPQYGKINDYKYSRGDFIFLAGGNPAEVVSDAGSGYGEEPKTGTIKVTSNPTGAKVEIDGGYAGTTPLTVGNLTPGTVRVTVSHEGFASAAKEATIRAGRRAVVNFTLEQEHTAKTGWLTVRPTPAEAKVRILNISPKYTPGMVLAAGRYHLEVSAEGYETEKRWVELAAGDDLQVSVSLAGGEQLSVGEEEVEPESNNYTEPVTGMEFVSIPGGCFQMGSPDSEKGRERYEGPVHEVCVDAFAMGKYEVTVGQWRRFINHTGYRTDAEKGTAGVITGGRDYDGCYVNNRPNLRSTYYVRSNVYWDSPVAGQTQTGDHPVSCVSHNDVKAFIHWLNRESGKEYRLPTEAEWEYAARAGTSTVRYWGDAADSSACSYGNVADKASGKFYSFPCNDGNKYTAPVGSFKPNAFGLYDMLGNVSEWTGDWYGDDYYRKSPRNNPAGPSSGKELMFRGGSWYDGPSGVRAAYRDDGHPWARFSILGFRLVLPLDGQR